MTHAFDLLVKTLNLKAPPRVLYFAVMNKLHCWLKTGNRKYEFERLYLENADPFDYRFSAYERRKYEKTLETILKWRCGGESALEIGCSIGVFTQMLAGHFGRVTALDISQEALTAAKERNQAKGNVHFVRDDLRFMDLGQKYDVITCAEVLYYVSKPDSQRVYRRLDRHLSANGIIILVGGVTIGEPTYFYFDGWERVFSTDFELISKEICEDNRPYRVLVFARRDSARRI
jgi:cyclopropane fatty-acyl-phospholipid synthase-like methyltransferase